MKVYLTAHEAEGLILMITAHLKSCPSTERMFWETLIDKLEPGDGREAGAVITRRKAAAKELAQEERDVVEAAMEQRNPGPWLFTDEDGVTHERIPSKLDAACAALAKRGESK